MNTIPFPLKATPINGCLVWWLAYHVFVTIIWFRFPVAPYDFSDKSIMINLFKFRFVAEVLTMYTTRQKLLHTTAPSLMSLRFCSMFDVMCVLYYVSPAQAEVLIITLPEMSMSLNTKSVYCSWSCSFCH